MTISYFTLIAQFPWWSFVLERLWSTVMDTLLSMTIFHEEINAKFFLYFAVLLGTIPIPRVLSASLFRLRFLLVAFICFCFVVFNIFKMIVESLILPALWIFATVGWVFMFEPIVMDFRVGSGTSWLLFVGMKIFHWLASDRVDYFARSLNQGNA